MEVNRGWACTHRSVLEWEWYASPNHYHVFMHIIMTANIRDKKWRGMEVKRGQLVTGLETLAGATGLTVRNIRTVLKNLELSGDIEQRVTSKGRVLTVVNYSKYQDKPDKVTIHRQSIDNPSTTTKQVTTNNNPPTPQGVSTPYQDYEKVWNEFAGVFKLSGVKDSSAWTAKRKEKVRALHNQFGDVGVYRESLVAIQESKFHLGENNRGWRMDFDYSIRPATVEKWSEAYESD